MLMCGVCGWITVGRDEATPAFPAMLDALSQRGPDGQGMWHAPESRCVLGHTRLAILDLAGSRQPMTNEDGSVVVTYNGEIYNFAELRRWLLGRGHIFASRGDTEVLVHLYEEQGPAMVQSLDGMFAFGIYDRRAHTLLLARDRIGIKPLSYRYDPRSGSLLFASDTRAILASGVVSPRMNPRALEQYLQFGYVIHPASWIEGVRQVEPGHTVLWDGGSVTDRAYYAWSYQPDRTLSDRAPAQSALATALDAATRGQLVSDVPLGSFLSGGIDSTAVSGFAQRALAGAGSALRSFTMRFPVREFDESARAREIATDLGTSHQEVPADDLRMDRPTVERIVDALGEPFGDSSALAVYLLCQRVRDSVTVALSGDGGDELFCGYVGMRKQRIARRLKIVPSAWRRVAKRLTQGDQARWRRLRRAVDLSFHDDPAIILEWARRWEPTQLFGLHAEASSRLFEGHEERLADLRSRIGDGERGGFAEQQVRFHMLVDLPCDCLFKVDRMSMAHGLEVRVPMLSNDMLAFGGRLPLQRRRSGRRTKEPLRTVAEGLAPTTARPSPKRGFGFPLDRWLQGTLPSLWREWELSAVLSRAGFDAAALDGFVSDYEHGRDGGEWPSRARAIQLWDLALLGVWMDRYHVS